MGLEEDYLRLLSKHGLSPQDMVTTADIVSRMPGSSPLVESLLQVITQDDVSHELQHPFLGATKLVRMVSDRRLRQALDRLYFNVFPSDDYGGMCARTENGYLCLVNDGVDALAAIISASLAMCTVQDGGKPALVRLKYLLRTVEGKIAVNTIFDIIIQYVNRKQLVPCSEMLSVQLQPFQCEVFGCLDLAMKTFVVAHECAHVVLNHFDDAPIQMVNTLHGKIEVRNPRFELEYAADIEAARILLRIAHLVGYDSGISFTVGGAMFLAIGVLIDIVDCKMNDLKHMRHAYTNTHPNPRVRLMHLNEFNRGALPKSALSMPIGALLGELIDLAMKAKVVEKESGVRVEVPMP